MAKRKREGKPLENYNFFYYFYQFYLYVLYLFLILIMLDDGSLGLVAILLEWFIELLGTEVSYLRVRSSAIVFSS